ncbi:hypothetical protein BQ8482_490003 [Mesorhizobium delmotii]|uniref:Uncharacterized protein n=1 Tax=Mesorhizobium delmotii TaxID=1631247 RepID=A0A2P9AU15_9HYPH|nr:hypothetical protein BQ8482_490003 [Mesorhizobium delmotii]
MCASLCFPPGASIRAELKTVQGSEEETDHGSYYERKGQFRDLAEKEL